MVATIRPISNSRNAGKYFYFTERNYECSKGWHVSQATQELGLNKLTRANFEATLDGKLNSEITLGRKTREGLKHHPGQELILSAPKSVSIMAFIAKDERVEEAHEKAVSTALDYVQRHMVYTRVQDKGHQILEKTNNAIIAKYTHLTSRPTKRQEKENSKLDQKVPDPQLHTHCLIANATLCEDGEWRSIVFDTLYDNKMHIGELYRLELARNIKALGYAIEIVKDRVGRLTFEIKEVPQEDIKEFSKRREHILEVAKKTDAKTAESLAYIAKTTREDKIEFSKEELQSNWKQRANIEILNDLKAGSLAKKIEFISEKEQQELGEESLKYVIDILAERESAWEALRLNERVLQETKTDLGIENIERMIKEHIESKILLKASDKNQNSYTTLKSLRLENTTKKLMQSLQKRVKPIATRVEINSLLLSSNLTVGQKDAVLLILNTRDLVVGIQGSAGTGKTTVLNNVKSIACHKRFELIGLAPTKAAVNILKKEVGIESQTLHLFLAKYQGVLEGRGTKEGRIKMKNDFHNKIVVLDEASLSATNHIHDLLKLSKELRFRMVMMGDFKQLGSIEAGKPFYYLQEHGMNVAIMGNIKRQKKESLLKAVYSAEGLIDRDERKAKQGIYNSLKLIGRNNVVDVSAKLKEIAEKAGKEPRDPTSSDLVQAAYEKWKTLRKEGKSLLIITPSNFLRKQLNDLIRSHFITGEKKNHIILESRNLTKAETTKAKNYNIGDVILFNRDFKIDTSITVEGQQDFIKKGDYYTVLKGEDKSGNKLCLLRFNNTGEAIEWDPAIISKYKKGAIELYKKEKLELNKGEHIKWTKNSKTKDFIINGAEAKVLEIKKDRIVFETENKETKVMDLNNIELCHIDHAYCSTSYSSQGKTVDPVIGIARAQEKFLKLTTQRSFYVTLSRARERAVLVVDSYKDLIRSLSHIRGAKTSSIEHQRELPELKEIADISQERRSVYIAKEVRTPQTTTSPSLKCDSSKPYVNFVNNPNLVKEAAIDIFGSINNHMSKGNQIRFGKKGSIVVNLNKGMWHDFSLGEGGSIYSLIKDKSVFDKYIPERAVASNLGLEKESQIKREKYIAKSIENTIAISDEKASLGQEYLKLHRKVDLSKINISKALRFTTQAWSSETKSYHSAILSVARNKLGEARAFQVIFLDNDTANKNKSLNLVKRSNGTLKGSFVELTANKTSKEIFIAEGIETALSVAQTRSNARVICSLGISNIKNIDFTNEKDLKEKQIVICADNDGKESNTRIIIEKAAENLAKQGFKSVMIIRPDKEGQDFNDVLKECGESKIREQIDPLFKKRPDYKKRFSNLQKTLQEIKDKQVPKPKFEFIDKIYKESKTSKAIMHRLIKEHGPEEVAQKIIENPNILGNLKGIQLLGFENKARAKATGLLKNLHDKIAEYDKFNKYKEQENAQLIKCKKFRSEFINKNLKDILKFNTKNLNYIDLKYSLENKILHMLATIGASKDYLTVKLVTERVAEQIVQHRERFGEDPNGSVKKDFFLRARYEAERKPEIEKWLNSKLNPQTTGELLDFKEKLSRMSAIDSRLALHAGKDIYFTPSNIKEVVQIINENEKKILALTKEHMAKGIDYVKAHFIALESVKHEENYGVHMPLAQQEAIRAIGNYVSNNYNALRKFGFTSSEARIAYTEGAKMALNYDKRLSEVQVSQDEVKQIQRESKGSFEKLVTNYKVSEKQNLQNAENKQSKSFQTNKNLQKEAVEISL